MSYFLAPKVADTFEKLDVPLRGRDFEIWSPILTIAKLIDDNLFKEILKKALEEVSKKEEETYKEERAVLAAIEEMFGSAKQGANGEYYVEFTVADLEQEMKRTIVEYWQELSAPEFYKKYDTRKIGRILSRMGIPIRRAAGGKRLRIVTEKMLNELNERYGSPSEPEEHPNRNLEIISDKSDISDINRGIQANENLLENLGKTQENRISDGVSEGISPERNVTVVTNVTNVTEQLSEPYPNLEIISDKSDISDIKSHTYPKENPAKTEEISLKTQFYESSPEAMHIHSNVTNVTNVTKLSLMSDEDKILSIIPVGIEYPFAEWEKNCYAVFNDKNDAYSTFWRVVDKAEKEGRIHFPKPNMVIRRW